MSYLQKEVGMLQKLKDTNYEAFHGDKDRAFRFMEQRLRAFPDYMDVVVRQQTLMPIWRAKYDGPEFREKCQDIDTERRRTHDDAIASVNALNRLSTKLDLPPFSRVDTNDRYAVAEMIQDYMSETYKTGIIKTESHPPINIKEHMHEIDQLTQGSPEL